VITGDLDAELERSLRAVAAVDERPRPAILPPSATWRPVPARGPASYATSLPFEIARQAARPPAEVAEALAASMHGLPWISAAEPSGDGYLTITVTPSALASVATRIVAAGPGCARSDALRGTSAVVRSWPDLAAAVDWQQAWREQAEAMTGRLAEASGAAITLSFERERVAATQLRRPRANSPVAAAVAHFGVSAIRYRLARTLPGRASQLDHHAAFGQRRANPFDAVQLAHADAASTLRWAADLQADRCDPGGELAAALGSEPERDMLGLLSWLPVRVASAAGRQRPDELPRYLEQVAACWTACRRAAPALPFGGAAAVADPVVTGARLLLADAVRAVLEVGLALAGIAARERV
jgi:arginyl-tRNA synthetase